MFARGLTCLQSTRAFCVFTVMLIVCFTCGGITQDTKSKSSRLVATLTQGSRTVQQRNDGKEQGQSCTGTRCDTETPIVEHCSGTDCQVKEHLIGIVLLKNYRNRIKRQLSSTLANDDDQLNPEQPNKQTNTEANDKREPLQNSGSKDVDTNASITAHQQVDADEGIQADERPCRDDLCNDRGRAWELEVPDPTDSPDSAGMACPPGYKKVRRGRTDFCQPQEVILTADRPKRRNTELACKEGEVVLKTRNGEECSSVDPPVNPQCPVGQVSVHTARGRQCVTMEIKDELVCPEGQLPLQTFYGLVCDTPNVIPKIVLAPEDECDADQVPVPTDSGEIICADMPASEPLCPPGLVPLGSAEKFVCVKASSVDPQCPPGWIPRATPMGVACEPPLQCSPGYTTVKTPSGLECQPMMKPVNIKQPLICSAGEVAVKTANGVTCQRMKLKHPLESGVGGLASLPEESDDSCPYGLVPVKTPVGRICQYVPDRFGFNKPPPQPQTCPPGTDAVTDEGGHMTCMKKPPASCPYGQVLMETAKGRMCVYHVDDTVSGICPHGQVFANGECRTVMKEPCSPGMEQVLTKSGTVECVNEGTGTAVSDDLSDLPATSTACTDGHILTMTDSGFVCIVDGSLGMVERLCDPGHVMARIAEEYICIREEDTSVQCEDGEFLTRRLDRFVCTGTSSNTSAPAPSCGTHEVLLTNDYGEPVCANLSAASRACGTGYRAVKTSGNQFVCRPERLEITCPVGFTLSLTEARPICVPVSGGDCLHVGSTDTSDCSSAVAPCEDGYAVDQSQSGYGCILQECDTGDCNHGCDSTNDVRPCDVNLDILLAGCNPDCANGGTCNNDTCVCPAGITGVACQEDEDECQNLHDNACQHQCENTFGSFRCTCPNGETLNTDGRTCTARSCIPGCLNDGSCVAGVCDCPSGFHGDFCQYDKDECAEYGDRLCQHQCRNTYGGYACLCLPGSRLRTDGRTCRNTTCIPGCRNGGDCVDQRCRCPAGFYGIVCQFDINECRREKPCSHGCRNLWGSYRCNCPAGLTLQSDGHTCRRA